MHRCKRKGKRPTSDGWCGGKVIEKPLGEHEFKPWRGAY